MKTDVNDFYPPHNSARATHQALEQLHAHLAGQTHRDPVLAELIRNARLALNGSTSITPPQTCNADALKTLALAATPGPWSKSANAVDGPNRFVAIDLEDADAAFIAAANPVAILALIARLESYQDDFARIVALTHSWVIAAETVDCRHTYDQIRAIAGAHSTPAPASDKFWECSDCSRLSPIGSGDCIHCTRAAKAASTGTDKA